MRERPIEFLIDPLGKAPRNLRDSIRKVGNASHGFRSSWLSGHAQDAFETSQEAFVELDYIQNELLRQRDAHKSRPNWTGSLFDQALQVHVGNICTPLSPQSTAWFQSLAVGACSLPSNDQAIPLQLGVALNKLKHRTTSVLNFSLPSPGGHLLYVLTVAGMGQPATLCEIDIQLFCSSCSAAANHV